MSDAMIQTLVAISLVALIVQGSRVTLRTARRLWEARRD